MPTTNEPTIAQLRKRFDLEKPEADQIDTDATMLLDLWRLGFDYGRRGVAIKGDEFKDDAALDIEHAEALLQLRTGAAMKFFTEAWTFGAVEAITPPEDTAPRRGRVRRGAPAAP